MSKALNNTHTMFTDIKHVSNNVDVALY